MNPPSIPATGDIAPSISRRRLLTAGAVGFTGLSLPLLLRAEEEGRVRRPRAKSCILLFQFGGPSQFETFDPKPHAPAEIRGEFGVISTKNPDLVIGEHLPRLAALADKFALVRGLHHDRADHNPGAYYNLTGRRPQNASVTANATSDDFPAPGAVLDRFRADRHDVPTAVSLPTMIADGPFRTPGEFAGFFGKAHDPLFILQDPNQASFSVERLKLPAGVDVARLARRREMLARAGQLSSVGGDDAAVGGLDAFQQRAMDLLSSPATERALAIGDEPDAVRERYGRTQYGQSVLLARRLVEHGVRFVTVYYSAGIGGWDTHKDNFKTLKDSRLPQTDLAVSSLIAELDQRGLLDETLIVWTGDFGRTPNVNKDAGRDHWPPCQTVLLAGGGIRGGALVGSSDKTGHYPKSDPVRPENLFATIYAALGIDPETVVRDRLNRPMPLADGAPIEKLFS